MYEESNQIMKCIFNFVLVIMTIFLCFFGANFVLEQNNKRKKELIKYEYSYNKAVKEDDHKRIKELLEMTKSFRDNDRTMEYENNYQLKKIELKGTVYETCADSYEKSKDFVECVRAILRNDVINKGDNYE